MSEWHIWFCCTAQSQSIWGFKPASFISVGVVCSPIKPLRLKVGAFPSSTFNPEQRSQENSTVKNIQFPIFQYYMITLRFPLFQCDQSVCLCDSNSLVSLTEESSAKTLAAWVNNSVLAGAETDRLCGSSVFPPLTLHCHFPSEDTLLVFRGQGGEGLVMGEGRGFNGSTFTTALPLCFDSSRQRCKIDSFLLLSVKLTVVFLSRVFVIDSIGMCPFPQVWPSSAWALNTSWVVSSPRSPLQPWCIALRELRKAFR